MHGTVGRLGKIAMGPSRSESTNEAVLVRAVLGAVT